MELVDGGKKNFGQRFVQDDSWKYIFPFAGTCNKKSHNVKNRTGRIPMRIFCFGDSNTYGYDARSLLRERLGENERWPEILGKLSGWEVLNEGMNGREIPESPWFLGSPVRSFPR